MPSNPTFPWPDGTRAALSITFDDARDSQLDVALPILDRHGVKGTFYVSLGRLEERLSEWRSAQKHGHELGNHSLRHPCSANFGFAEGNALEDYTVERMEQELAQASRMIEDLTGRAPATFAYPCGQTFVGRGEATRSYVPVVARQFLAGRNAFDETHNAPSVCDLAHLYSMDADGADSARLRSLVEAALDAGGWLILMVHDVGTEAAHQVLAADVMDAFCLYATDPSLGVWFDTVEAIAQHVGANQSL